MSIDRDKLNRWSEDDAFDFCVEQLQKLLNGQTNLVHRNSQFDFSSKWIKECFYQRENIRENNDQVNAEPIIAPKIMSALWRLCLRGVLRPSTRMVEELLSSNSYFPGSGYSFTDSGRTWLLSQRNDFSILSPRAFSDLIDHYENLFGKAFTERAHNAVISFDSGAFLASCVMSGAACESIYLALAFEKSGDKNRILSDYRSTSGTKKLKDFVERNQNGTTIEILKSGFNILKLWRDDTAHGEFVGVGDIEARAAINTIINIAQISEKHWDQLTGKTVHTPLTFNN